MFGFVKPFIPELRVKDNEFYKSVYCGVCRAMKRETGALSCASLSYDAVFVALVRLAVTGEAYTVKKERCMRHPFHTRAVMHCDDSLKTAAQISAALLYGKLADDISDERGKRRAAARLALPYARKFSRRANVPEANAAIAEGLAGLAELERSGEATPDACADISGKMTAEVAALGLSGAQRDIMYEAAFHIGRWIYLADAVCDYPEDMKRGRFNPFSSYDEERMREFAMEEAYSLTVPEIIAAENAITLADCRDEHINACIENIFHYGMKNSFYTTARKEWHDDRSI